MGTVLTDQDPAGTTPDLPVHDGHIVDCGHRAGLLGCERGDPSLPTLAPESHPRRAHTPVVAFSGMGEFRLSLNLREAQTGTPRCWWSP